LDPNSSAPTDEFQKHPLYKMLGYFSIIGLVRVHCMMGDYHLAIKTLEPIDLTNKKGLFTRVTACHITLYYYLGFSYLMMRRYVDSIKTLTTILLYISRTKQYHTRSYQYESMMKKSEQMYALLAIAVALCPQRIDENIHAVLREKYGEKMARMQRGEETAFSETFTFACPKFVQPATPDYGVEPSPNQGQEAMLLQQRLFMQEVRQQVPIPIIRSYLKLYSTISIPKLTSFLDTQEEEAIRSHLACFKHKTHNLVWGSPGSPLSGKVLSSSDVDFFVDLDMVHIVDSKVVRRYGDYFIRNINKFEEILKDIPGATSNAAITAGSSNGNATNGNASPVTSGR